jgi:hypothetical protein
MKSRRASAICAAVFVVLFLKERGIAHTQHHQANTRSGESAADDQEIAKASTGTLIVRVYSDSGGRFEKLMAKPEGKGNHQYGVQVYVEEKLMGMPPLRQPLVLIAPGNYRVGVAYPDRKNGYFSITTKQVKVVPGSGIVVRMQPRDRDWSEGRRALVAVIYGKRNTRGQLIEELDKWEASFKDVPDQIDRVRTNKYFRQLAAQDQQMSTRPMLMGLNAYDEDTNEYNQLNLEIDREQVRWVGRSIKDEYGLVDYSDQQDSYASRAIKEIDSLAAQATNLGENDVAGRALKVKAWILNIMSADSSVLREVDSVVNGLADRLDDSSEQTGRSVADDPLQVRSGDLGSTVTGVAFRDETLAVVQTFYRVNLINVNDGKKVKAFEKLPEDYAYLWRLLATPNGRLLISSGGEGFGSHGFICEWNVADGKSRRYIKNKTNMGGKSSSPPIVGVAFTGDGNRVLSVSGLYDLRLKLWDTQTWKEVWAVEIGHSRSVAIAPDGRTAVAGLERGVLSLLDMSDGKELRRFNGQDGTVNAVVFSRDGKRIVSGGDDGTVRVWDVTTGRSLFSLTGHIGSVEQLIAARNPNQILSGGEDGTLRLWDIETAKEITVMKGHAGIVETLAVSPSGTRVLSGGEDFTWRLWRLPE